MKLTGESKEKNIYIIMLTLILGFIFYNVPIGHDDWTWGSYIGIERLQSLFENYNGRYFGGILTIILTRLTLPRIIIMTGITVGIIILISSSIIRENSEDRGKIDILLIIGSTLILLTPKEIFSQTFSWISGFSNYVPPIFLMYIYFNIIKKKFFQEDYLCDKKNTIAVFIVVFSTQLFIEHITLYMVFITIFIAVYSYIKFKNISVEDVSAIIGSIAGALIMFSNGAYHKIAQNEDGYRTISQGSIANLVKDGLKQYLTLINKQFFMNIVIITCILSIISIVLFIKYINKKGQVWNISKICIIITTVYPLYILYLKLYSNFTIINQQINLIIQGLISPLFYISILVIMIQTIENKLVSKYCIFLLVSSLILLIPLMFVKPIGGRNYLASYILLVTLALQLFDYINIFAINNISKYTIIPINICVCICLLVIFFAIGKDAKHRNEYIMEQINNNNEIIYVPRIRYGEYLQNANPKFSNGYGGEYGFRAYYHLSKEQKIFLEDN